MNREPTRAIANVPVSTDSMENINHLKEIFRQCADIAYEPIAAGPDMACSAWIVYCESLADQQSSSDILSVLQKMEMRRQGNGLKITSQTIRDMKDEKRYEERMEQYIKKKMASVLNTLRKSKADVLGIGHKLYLRHPSRWKKIKPEWPERFAGMPIELSVDVHLLNSRMMSPEPFVRVGED